MRLRNVEEARSADARVVVGVAGRHTHPVDAVAEDAQEPAVLGVGLPDRVEGPRRGDGTKHAPAVLALDPDEPAAVRGAHAAREVDSPGSASPGRSAPARSQAAWGALPRSRYPESSTHRPRRPSEQHSYEP